LTDSRQELDQATEARPLFAHQTQAIEFILSPKVCPPTPENYTNSFNSEFGIGCAALFHEPGLGKTRTVIETFRILKKRNPLIQLLVVAPISLLEAAWRKDLEKFAPELTFHNCHGGNFPTYRYTGAPVTDVLAINYEFFQRTENLKKLMSYYRSLPKELVLMCSLDESSKIKNHQAATTKGLMQISKVFKYRIVMSGTPAPNSEAEYWAQLEFTFPGLFGKWSTFHKSFFQLERNGVPIDTNGMIMSNKAMSELFKRGAEYVLTDKTRSALFGRMLPYIHTAKKRDCLDLPEQIEECRYVKLVGKQKTAYEQMKRHLVVELNEHRIVAQVALSKVMKLREISSGFAFSDTGELVEFECPKLAVMLEILESLGDRQAILWGQFSWEIEKMESTLKAMGHEVRTLYGDTGTPADKQKSILDFQEGRAKYFIANPKSAAHGLTLVNAAHHIFFSLDYSWEAFKQGKDRTDRIGQKFPGVCYFILGEDTIDMEILDVLHGKGDVQDIVYKLKNQKPKP